MSLTLDEKVGFAKVRAAEIAAEKHFYDAAQPHSPLGFSVTWRNAGHWDVFAEQVPGKDAAWLTAHGEGSSINGRTLADIDEVLRESPRERAFCIRGEAGRVVVRDERWNPHLPHPREPQQFRSVTAAMLWVCEELMQEPALTPTA